MAILCAVAVVGRCRTQFGFHAAEIVSQRRLIAMQGMCRQSKEGPGSILGAAGTSPQNLSSADVVVGAESEPGGEMRSGGPSRHVSAHFAEQHEDQRHQPWNLSEIHAVQFVRL